MKKLNCDLCKFQTFSGKGLKIHKRKIHQKWYLFKIIWHLLIIFLYFKQILFSQSFTTYVR